MVAGPGLGFAVDMNTAFSIDIKDPRVRDSAPQGQAVVHAATGMRFDSQELIRETSSEFGDEPPR
jgi:hypothetical protein